MLVLIWIHTVGHSDIVPERFFGEKSNFKKKEADDIKSMKNYPAMPACKELRLFDGTSLFTIEIGLHNID